MTPQEIRFEVQCAIKRIESSPIIGLDIIKIKPSTRTNFPKHWSYLSEDVKNFYLAFDKVSISWKEKATNKPQSEMRTGSLIFFPICEMDKTDYTNEVTTGIPERIIADYKFRVLGAIDFQNFFGFFEDAPDNIVVFNRPGGCFESLQIDFATFLKLFCFSLGFHYWVRMITQLISLSGNSLEQQRQLYISTTEQIIPEFELTIFEDFYKSMRNSKLPTHYTEVYKTVTPSELFLIARHFEPIEA